MNVNFNYKHEHIIPWVRIDIRIVFSDYHPTTRNAKKYYKKRKVDDSEKPVKPPKKQRGADATQETADTTAKPKAKSSAKSAAKK